MRLKRVKHDRNERLRDKRQYKIHVLRQWRVSVTLICNKRFLSEGERMSFVMMKNSRHETFQRNPFEMKAKQPDKEKELESLSLSLSMDTVKEQPSRQENIFLFASFLFTSYTPSVWLSVSIRGTEAWGKHTERVGILRWRRRWSSLSSLCFTFCSHPWILMNHRQNFDFAIEFFPSCCIFYETHNYI